MTALDPKGLEAAEKYALSEGWVAPDDDDIAFLVGIIRAYLDAARTSAALAELQRLGQECEREADRLAVVVGWIDDGVLDGAAAFVPADEIPDDQDWRYLESRAGNFGPFRRQIVRVHLLRPEPVGEISGTTDPA